MKAGVFEDHDAFEAAGAGAVMYLGGGAIIKCPGCGKESACDERKGDNHPSWVMDRATNTWQPSVHHSKGCGWHGYLRNGQWESV